MYILFPYSGRLYAAMKNDAITECVLIILAYLYTDTIASSKL